MQKAKTWLLLLQLQQSLSQCQFYTHEKKKNAEEFLTKDSEQGQAVSTAFSGNFASEMF